ncbi:VWA domain-containing protein [Fontisphaera persica]|uniref:VWA domain-containing protein n=1 Tax=Fontisphaera persica TaxID=2974023 RepID=UPI0024C03EF4|nr:VWA domain-containing protein [Fontisphaera persica]WCJ60069.1 VWA domain-containing protein [Fontisphaera persica]
MKELQPWFETFRFESWWLLPLLLLLPLWAWLRGRWAPVAAVPFSTGDLLKPAAQRTRFRHGRWLWWFRLLALALLLLALARPQVEKGMKDVEAKGINIMLVLDFSSTMNKRDFTMEGRKVTRAQALIKVISEFMRARPKDRLGLVRFDAEAFLVSPLTLDHDYLIQRIATEKNGRGTAPGSGVLIATEHLLPATNQTKVIILVSDAEQVNQGPRPEEVARAIAPLGVRVHVIQIIDFKEMATVNLSRNEMAQMAKLTGGQVFQVADFTGLRSVYQQIDLLEKASFKEGQQRVYRELAPWLVAAALALLLLELLLAHTVWRKLP